MKSCVWEELFWKKCFGLNKWTVNCAGGNQERLHAGGDIQWHFRGGGERWSQVEGSEHGKVWKMLGRSEVKSWGYRLGSRSHSLPSIYPYAPSPFTPCWFSHLFSRVVILSQKLERWRVCPWLCPASPPQTADLLQLSSPPSSGQHHMLLQLPPTQPRDSAVLLLSISSFVCSVCPLAASALFNLLM